MKALEDAGVAAGADAEIAALRRCVRDLVALSTLPAAWMHAAPLGIVESLAEVVLRMLKLDLAYVRVPQARGEMLEAGHTRASAAAQGRGAALGRLLAERIRFGASAAPAAIPDPEDGTPLQLSVTPINLDRDCGWLVAASRRADFPGAEERLLLGVAANQLAMVLQRRSAEDLLREEAKSLETLNRTGEALAGELSLERVVQQVTDAATRLTGAKFGAFFYNVRNEKGESYQLYTLSGAPREAFEKFSMPRNTAVFAPTFTGTAIVRSDDIRKDPRYGRSAPHYGPPPGHLPVVSYLAVPVVSRSKEVIGGLFFAHPEAGVFDARAERLATGIAAQAAVAIDNARLYERLRESAVRLADADRRKDEFLATLAHELRNPLAPLRNGLESLRLAAGRPELGEPVREMMERQLGHLVRLVDDLLDMSRISTGKIELRREWSELGAIVHSALESIGPLIERSGHRLELQLPAEPVYLEADPVRLAQVLCNLLNNAAKYTERGGTIVLSAARRDREVEVSVRDNGIGIPPAMLPRVFELFTQVDGSLEKAHGGLGIGLTIVKRLVELHGGSVEARSEGLGKGSEFMVRLPMLEPGARRKTAPRAAATPPAPRRILVIDDNADAAESLALMLQLMGSEVRTASDGAEGLRAAETLRPELVLLDLGMPGMNGFDVCRSIRAQPWARGTAVVALSGWGQEEHRARAREAGFDHYLVKPVDIEALRRLVGSLARSA